MNTCEINNFDLNKPINGSGNPKSCDHIRTDFMWSYWKKEVQTSLTLLIAYINTCIGSGLVDTMNVTYDVLNRTSHQFSLHCINGTFVNILGQSRFHVVSKKQIR